MVTSLKEEVTDLCYIGEAEGENQTFVTVGWDKNIHIWPDSKEEVIEAMKVLPQDGQQTHADDITQVCFAKKDNLLFTGAYDGSVIAWNYETGYMKSQLHELDPSMLALPDRLDLKSVECLIVLEKRARISDDKEFVQGFLLSGTADQNIRIFQTWNLQFTKMFNVSHGRFDDLSCLSATEDCEILFTGDTAGNVRRH